MDVRVELFPVTPDVAFHVIGAQWVWTLALHLSQSVPEVMAWLILLVKMGKINWVAYGSIVQVHEDKKETLYFSVYTLVYTCSIIVPINTSCCFYLSLKVQKKFSHYVFPVVKTGLSMHSLLWRFKFTQVERSIWKASKIKVLLCTVL